jgi:hypothetical protein
MSPSAGEGVKLKSSLHRTAIVLAGAVIGLIGVTAAANPASAHNAWVTGTANCSNGKNVVTWKFTNDWATSATIHDLQLPPGQTPVSTAGNLYDGQVLLHGETDFTQVVDAAPSAKISFTAYWTTDNYTDSNTDNQYQVTLDQGCGKDTPPPAQCVNANDAQLTHTFVVDKDGATTVINLGGTKLCDGVKLNFTSVSYYAPKPQFDVPQYLFDKDSGSISNDNPVLKLHVKIPPCYTQVDTFIGTEDQIIKVITKDGPRYGDLKLGSAHGPGSISKGPQAWYNGGSQACVTPASTSVPDCTGGQTVNLSNNGRYDETFTVKYADQVKTVTVAGGKGESVAVPAGSGTVTVSAEGMPDQTYNWTAPKTCAPPTVKIANTCKDVTITVTNPKGVTTAKATVTYGKESKDLTVPAGSSAKATFAVSSAKYASIKFAGSDQELRAVLKKLNCSTPTGGTPPGLAITGSAASTVAGGAVLLLIAGGVFFFIARRRKVRFTA